MQDIGKMCDEWADALLDKYLKSIEVPEYCPECGCTTPYSEWIGNDHSCFITCPDCGHKLIEPIENGECGY